jgi:hemerythrin superfamily protein
MRLLRLLAHTKTFTDLSRNKCYFKRTASSSSQNTQLIDIQVKADHRELINYYNQYKSTGDMKWYNQFVYELCRHSVGEELILYPLLESLGPKGKDLTYKARRDHHNVKELLSQMESMVHGPKEYFDRKFDSLIADLFQHMKNEEEVDLKLIADSLSLEDRLIYGEKFQNRKKIVPTRPHPLVPERPVILEEAMGLLTAPLDKFRDLFRDFPSEQQQQQRHKHQ